MLVVKLYRYIKRKIQHARNPQDAAVSESDPTSQDEQNAAGELVTQAENGQTPPKSGKSSWKWKVILMVGLAIPVFLETLDYTGMFWTRTWIFAVD